MQPAAWASWASGSLLQPPDTFGPTCCSRARRPPGAAPDPSSGPALLVNDGFCPEHRPASHREAGLRGPGDGGRLPPIGNHALTVSPGVRDRGATGNSLPWLDQDARTS